MVIRSHRNSAIVFQYFLSINLCYTNDFMNLKTFLI